MRVKDLVRVMDVDNVSLEIWEDGKGDPSVVYMNTKQLMLRRMRKDTPPMMNSEVIYAYVTSNEDSGDTLCISIKYPWDSYEDPLSYTE